MPTLTRRDTIRAAGATLLAATALRATAATPANPKPLVYGHRGSSALRPEHTLASYAKAFADGADFIEPDLVITRDGVLVARHENNIAETTDVARHPEFASRKATKTIDGQPLTGWFVEDFTLAELKTLRAIERLGKLRLESQSYDGQFQVLTFEEMIEYVAAESAARGRVVGIVPELKHSTYFKSIGLPLEDRFLATIAAHDYTRRAPLNIQSFETANLRYLRSKLGRPSNIKLMQLVSEAKEIVPDSNGKTRYGDLITPAGLRDMATYADIVAPQVRGIIPLGPDGRLGQPTTLVKDAHAAGLKVGVWTFRPENFFLAGDFKNGAGPSARNPEGSIAEIRRYLAAGIDGFFTDDPAIGRAAVDGL